MSDYTILEGDCLDTLRTLPDYSVQCVVTSPPYYGLRDYGVNGQIGLEETPEAYVEKLVQVFREVRRVLKDDGTLWLNLGDSYWGGKGSSNMDWSKEHLDRKTLEKSYHHLGEKGEMRPTDGKHPVIKPKDLIGIPWMVAFALRADGWYLRQDIIWHKPNPMPESVTDRCTKAHEYIFLLSKNSQYYYDVEAIKEKSAAESMERYKRGSNYTGEKPYAMKHGPRGSAYSFARKVNEEPAPGQPNQHRENRDDVQYSDFRNKRSVWTVSTKPYKEAHFATFPPNLIEPCILAGSREGDTVLDPFNGSGTTGAVSLQHRRKYIGCELNPEYIKLTKKRFANVQIEAGL